MPSSNRNIEVMKKLLLIILLLSQPIYANSNEMSKFIIPHVTICDFDDPYPYNLVDIAREIAEFEANLAKDLADQSKLANDAQVAARMEELALEQELKAFEAKAKFSPTVCERNEGDYEAYILGIKN